MLYLMATNTDYVNGRLTGAHYRFLELVKGLAKTDKVLIISRGIPQLEGCANIIECHIANSDCKYIPDHIASIVKIVKSLKRIKKQYDFDAAVSFTPFITIAFGLSGLKNVVSLFREDLIGYHKVIGTNKAKIRYSSFVERLAVKFSKKIIVQCKNDKQCLIERIRNYDENIAERVYVQINNANASWMYRNEKRDCKPNQKTSILFLGEFSNCRKGQGILLPVVGRLLDEGFEIQLLVAGDGKELACYKAKYAGYKDILFLGRINVKEFISHVDMLIVPSLIDSCPNTVLEGLNAGVAVYGANSGGIPDLLENPDFIFEPNENSLELFLRNVLKERKYISDVASQQIVRNRLTFDWAEKMKGIIDG